MTDAGAEETARRDKSPDEAVRVDGERFPVGDIDPEGVCVVTVRAAPKPQNATRDVLAILAEIATVSLVTTELSADSPIRGRFDLTEVDSEGTAPGSMLTAAVRFLLNQLRLCVAIARQDADVVWFFGATAYLLPVLGSRLLGRRVVLQSRGDVPLSLRLTWEERAPDAVARALAGTVRALERIDFALADRVVTYSPAMAETIGLDSSDPSVSPLGSRFVDLDAFRPRTAYEDRERVVGFVGRLDVEKGIDVLATAARRLPDDITFVFVGDGPYRERLERALGAEIEAGKVELVGWVDHDEIPTYLNRFRLLVMPSEPTEGLPTTIAEAFACGTPVYATPVSGIPDLLVDGETGFHIGNTDPETIATRIEVILDREDLPAIAGRCRAIAEERYSKEAAVTRYRAILDRL